MNVPPIVKTRRARTGSSRCAAILVAALLAACSTAPAPLDLTYPHPWVDYDAIDGLDEIASRLSPYFVKVFVYDAYNAVEAVGAGSGIIVDEIGHVITAAHIVKRGEHRAFVKTMSGITLPARIVRVDPEQELALLRISIRYESIDEPPGTGEPVPGQAVFAIGTQPDYDPVVSAGTVRAYLHGEQFRSGQYGFTGPIVLDMHVDTGYSGGPVFSLEGELLGMVVGFHGVDNERTAPDRTLTSYALPSSKLYEFYYQWR